MERLSDRTAAIRLILRAMRILGVWPWPPADSDESVFWVFLKKYYQYLLHLPITFTFIGLMWLEVFVSNNLEQAGQVLYMSITELALIVKILNIWYQGTEAWQLLHHMQNEPIYELCSEKEQKFWQHEQRIFKWRFYIYGLVALGVVYSACTGVLFLKGYELPFAYYVPFDWRNDQRYWYAYGYSVAGISVTCISDVSLDIIGCYFMFHVSLLFRVLGMRLAALGEVEDHITFNQELRRIFKLHQYIRRITLQCENFVSPYILAQIVLSAFIICFSGYRLQSVGIRANPGQFIAMLQFVSVMVLQIFLPCYYGNEVTVYADKLTNEVYNTNWLQCKPHTRKLLNAYMEHLKRPVRIRAGYFFEVGLPVFMKSMQNAYSFFALMLNVSK